MIIKKYLVKNVNEAMSKIRYELGKDAIIISQRKVRKPGFAGLFSGKLIEVTAAVESTVKDEKPEKLPKNHIISNTVSEEDEFKKSIESIKKLMESEIAVTNTVEKPSALNNMIKEHNANVEKERRTSAIDSLAGNEEESRMIRSDLYGDNSYESKNSGLSVESVHKEVEELKELINKVMVNKGNLVEEADKPNESEEEKTSVNLDSLKEKLKDLDIDEQFCDDILKSASDYKDAIAENIQSIIGKFNGNEFQSITLPISDDPLDVINQLKQTVENWMELHTDDVAYEGCRNATSGFYESIRKYIYIFRICNES